MRPRGAAAPPARRLTTAGLAVSLIAAGTAILCVVAVLAVTLTGEAPRALPPEQQAAQAYLSALGSNDAGRIWATVELSDVQLPPGDHLLGRNDLGRMLTVAANRHQRIASVTLVESSHTPASVVYQATYREGGDFSSAQLTLQKVGPRWKVVLSPAAIAIPALPAGVSVAVDGTPLKVAAGQPATVSVLPGVHAVRESTAAPYADRSLQVTADQPLPATARPDRAASGRGRLRAGRRGARGFQRLRRQPPAAARRLPADAAQQRLRGQRPVAPHGGPCGSDDHQLRHPALALLGHRGLRHERDLHGSRLCARQ